MWCCVVACYLVLPKKIVLPSPKWSQHVQLLRSCAPIRKLSSAESPLRADLKGGQTWNRSELPWIANSQQLWKMDENGSRIIRIACLIEKWGSICRLFFFLMWSSRVLCRVPCPVNPHVSWGHLLASPPRTAWSSAGFPVHSTGLKKNRRLLLKA